MRVENQELCTVCGGDCCKKSGCDYAPSDFEEVTTNALFSILEEGNISIVSILHFELLKDGQLVVEPFLYLRARNQNRPIVDLLSIKTPCSMLREDGCSYDLKHRPSGGANFVPKPNRQCHPDIDPYQLMKPWESYQRVLERLVKRFTGSSVDVRLREDVFTLFSDLYQEHYEGVHPREIEDVNQMIPMLIRAYPEEYLQARGQKHRNIPFIKVKK